MKIKNFRVPPKMVKNQCLSNWFACPKYLRTQVPIGDAVTWKPRVGILSAIALPTLKLVSSGRRRVKVAEEGKFSASVRIIHLAAT